MHTSKKTTTATLFIKKWKIYKKGKYKIKHFIVVNNICTLQK